jgi:hypothetical protein
MNSKIMSAQNAKLSKLRDRIKELEAQLASVTVERNALAFQIRQQSWGDR